MFTRSNIIGSRHRLQFGTRTPECVYDILYEGVEYRVDEVQLAALYRGVPIDELDLLRLDEVDDDEH
jgi:hypothetical protein